MSSARPSHGATDPLEREAELARAAISAKFRDLKASLENAADPRQWAREHPWAAVSIAAAAGFATAFALTRPPKSNPTDEDRSSAPRNSGAAANSPPTNGYAAQPGGYPPPRAPGITGSILSMLFELAKIFMSTHLMPLFQAWQQGLAEQAIRDTQPPGPHAPNDEDAPTDAQRANSI